MASLVAYKAAIVVLSIITVASAGMAGYYYRQEGLPISRAADLNSQISSLNSQIDSYKSQVSTLNNQITSLNSQINTLNNQISQLQALNSQLQSQNSQLTAQIQQLQSQVSQLQSQVSQLQSQLADFQRVNIKTDIVSSSNCPLFQNCKYTLKGSYANFGLVTAHSTTVAVIYWSGPSGTGQQLCSITYSLGNIPGLSIAPFPSQDCQGSTRTEAESVTWTWDWN